MKLRLLLLNFLFFAFINVVLAAPPSYIQTKDGVIVFTDPIFAGTSKAVKLEVVSDNIIRIIAAPGKEIAAVQSLVTVYTRKADLVWNVVSSKETVTLKTKKLSAIVDLKTGAVSFCDNSSKKILIEKPTGGRSFQSAIFDGRRQYHLTQTFQTTDDDAWYGLGQHQDGIMNYKGQQVTFIQNNTEVAIPFLISSKNYGIRWVAPYQRMPVFVKAGSIIPFRPALQYMSEKSADTITLNIYSSANAFFNLKNY